MSMIAQAFRLSLVGVPRLMTYIFGHLIWPPLGHVWQLLCKVVDIYSETDDFLSILIPN